MRAIFVMPAFVVAGRSRKTLRKRAIKAIVVPRIRRLDSASRSGLTREQDDWRVSRAPLCTLRRPVLPTTRAICASPRRIKRPPPVMHANSEGNTWLLRIKFRIFRKLEWRRVLFMHRSYFFHFAFYRTSIFGAAFVFVFSVLSKYSYSIWSGANRADADAMYLM